MYKKVLTCTSAGTIATQSKQAYGEWEFDVNKGDEPYINFISDGVNGTFNNDGYQIYINEPNKTLFFRKTNSGSSNVLFSTATSYININTWYRTKVARLKSEGVFRDIPTLQVSDLVNSISLAYNSFTSNGRFGFNASSILEAGIKRCGTADEISIVDTEKYLVEFDAILNSGTAPVIRLRQSQPSGTISNTETVINGRNSHILTATETTTGVISFYNNLTATNYTVSGLTIRRIYDADAFAVFIKGGAYGNTETGWTLVPADSGSNPRVDATYTTSEFFVTDLDEDDEFSNLKITNEVKQ